MLLTDEITQHLRSIIDTAMKVESNVAPGIVALIATKDGQPCIHAAGKRGVSSPGPMATDSVFWLASCTKMVTGIACMQLVEHEILSLHDIEQIKNCVQNSGMCKF